MSGNRVLTSLIWRFGERITAQIVTLVVSIILARLLSPSDYGLLSMVLIFITFSEVLINNGFGTALIQKKNADETDFSSVFYFQICFSIFLYLVLFLASPLIGKFYNNALLSSVLRVLGLRLIISAINNVQHAYVSKHMLFRKFFWSTLGGTIVSAIVGIILAYNGFGVWALVAQYLTNSFIDMVVIFFTIPWKPQLVFSFSRLRNMIAYSWKIFVNALFDTTYSQMRALVIGKKYTSEDLAFFNKGQQFPTIIENNINMSVESVLFPAIANIQDDKEKVKQMMRMSIKTCSYIMCPLLIGLAIISEPFVKLILTEKWLPCVPYMQIYCIGLMFNPIHTLNVQALKALGESGTVLRLNIINKCFGIVALLITMNLGPLYIAYGLLATNAIALFVNTFPNRALLGYGFFRQMGDILPGLLLSIIMAVPVWYIERFFASLLVCIVFQVIFGAIVYLGFSVLTKNETFFYLLRTISSLFQKDKIVEHGKER